MIRLTEQQVLSVHKMMIKATGGLGGMRDMGLLQSALNAPFQAFGALQVKIYFVNESHKNDNF